MDKDDLFGELASPDLLKVNKAKRLLQYITSNTNLYLKLVEIRQRNNHEKETIIINLGVERPQKFKIDIRSEESIALVFRADDLFAPEVLMLREDFPKTPHQNLQPELYPKSLCLHAESYDSIKLTWTPSNFLNQIQNWLRKTANIDLHAADQALEPFILPSFYNLIIPKRYDPAEQSIINIYRHHEGNNITLFMNPMDQVKKSDFVALCIKIPPTIHGIIRYIPDNLSKLRCIFLEADFDINNEITHILKKKYLEKENEAILEKKVIFIFSVPLTRNISSDVEEIDYYAYITDKTLNTLGSIYGIFEKLSDSSIKSSGYIIRQKQEIGNLENVKLLQVNIQFTLDAHSAASCNNVQHFSEPIAAIGMGALGSQIVNNLVRSGFGKWKLIDEDIILPHNAARHLLPNCFTGYSKVNSCKDFFNQTIDDDMVDDVLNLNILKPNQAEKDNLMNVLKNQKYIFDFSASIAVSRYLASNDFARSISIYLTPDGKNLILVAEDDKRNVRLDWLEMLHYREVINNHNIVDSLKTATIHRYGNSCRDISVQLSQDDFAMWSGFASKRIRELVSGTKASLDIFLLNGYEVKYIMANISNIHKLKYSSWTIIFDDYLIDKISDCREKSLPNETGGVLLGNFDSEYKICYIIDIIPSPIDSEELPLSFFRGFNGLYDKVKNIEEKTIGQVIYIGEWHSHPNGYSIYPSTADLNTFEWLKTIMDRDSIPSIMMIIGENKSISIIGSEPIV